ncbi:MAG: prenyltransferase/squalene oxidase repeat-containing protein [Isosphaeraceae bacterium]
MSGSDTGLDLESFLLLLRADIGSLSLYALGTLILGLLLWLSWGSRRALRRCLAVSVVAHVALAVYGSTVPSFFRALGPSLRDDPREPHIKKIRVLPVSSRPDPAGHGGTTLASASAPDPAAPRRTALPSLDFATEPIKLDDARQSASHLDGTSVQQPAPSSGESLPRAPLELARATPVVELPASRLKPEARPGETSAGTGSRLPAINASKFNDYLPEVVKLKAEQSARSAVAASALAVLPSTDLRREAARAERNVGASARPSTSGSAAPIPLAHATPSASRRAASVPALVDLTGPSSGRNLTAVPPFYRSRLDANRSARAQRSGASAASEQAVERALDWLARHQDADGRWDGGTARDEDGKAVDDDDFTVHCPPGQTCFGECAYWEADTAMTGLALLSYLGAGYTQKDGKYAITISKGLDWLLSQQKANGDLRGRSRAVGMYCHAMATLALCEAYALSLDKTLRDPAQRAVAFLVRGRASDGQAWRYQPGEPIGDTSILGWVVMAFKSAREVGLAIPGQADVDRGTRLWLDRVASGRERGLARYQPREKVTPTMTAEAWVCRQFLGIGGPGPASSEAAAYLMQNESDQGDTNFYYWYYGTLALYQHGGRPWSLWNARVRDRIVKLQRSTGCPTGSWDPDDSIYGTRGGRIYCTTLATLTLEVYYRYLRLYAEPNLATDPSSGADAGPVLEAPPR